MKARRSAFAAAAFLVAGALLAACAGPKSAARIHPEKVQGMPQCSSCHDASRASVDHGADWTRTHGRAAVTDQRVCELCHRPSSCADCHGAREEIKPSTKRGSRFDPATPHRGDYLSQHRADGRLDPASCLPCHGRKNEERCRTCHK